jgi:hypothetical protein
MNVHDHFGSFDYQEAGVSKGTEKREMAREIMQNPHIGKVCHSHKEESRSILVRLHKVPFYYRIESIKSINK